MLYSRQSRILFIGLIAVLVEMFVLSLMGYYFAYFNSILMNIVSMIVIIATLTVTFISWEFKVGFKKTKIAKAEDWLKFATELGFEILENQSPAVGGDYRNHHVEVYGDPRFMDDLGEVMTRYVVEFKNRNRIVIYLRKRSLFTFIRNRQFSHWTIHQLKVGDNTFDNKFLIQGFNEQEVKAVLDFSIRTKLLNLRSTFYEVEIGHEAELKSLELANTDTYRRESFMDTNQAWYVDEIPFLETITNTPRFISIIDTMIDIAEKIEAIHLF